MRDVGRWLVPAGDAPVDDASSTSGSSTTSPRCTRRAGAGTTTSASCRSATATRSSAPTRSTCEAALGFPQPVPRIAAEGWQRLDDASPELAAALRPLRRRAVGAVRRPGRDAQDPAPRRHQVLEPRDAARRAHGLRRLVDDRRGSAARRDRALARAQPGPPPARIREGRDRRRPTAPRSSGTASTPRRGSSVSSSLCLLGVMLQLGVGEGVRRDRRASSPGGVTARSTPRASSPQRVIARGRQGSGQSSRSGCSRTISGTAAGC